jgi:hypothetical protein
MAEIFYIYEIPGVKVGCTTNMERRQKQQRDKGEMILLESHTDIDKATERERELQLEKGYPVDLSTYANSYKNGKTICQTKENIKKRVKSHGYTSLFKPVNAYKVTSKLRGKYGVEITSKKFLKRFDSIKQCAEELNLLSCDINNVCRPASICTTLKGYTFEYAN